MKIVEVISSLESKGGAEVFIFSLIKKMKEQNEVHLIVLYDGLNNYFSELIQKYKIDVYFCHKKKKIDFKASRTLKQILLKIKPDIVNYHLSFLLTYFIAFRFKKVKWSLIETFHSIPGNDLSIIDNLLRKLYINKHKIRFIGISDQITKFAIKKFRNINIVTIYNGIELRTNEPNKRKTIYDFVCVANLLPVKNHELLISSFKYLVMKYPNLKLVIVGGGPLHDFLINKTKELRLENNVTFTGFVDDSYKYLLASSIFVLTSKREGNPISILEAMSCGLPIIAPRVGGIPDVVVSETNGFLFNNAEELIESMERMYLNKSLQKSIGIRNSNDILKYSIDSVSCSYNDFFLKEIGKHFD